VLARVLSATVIGIQAAPIHVEVDVSQGLPGCNIVGLPDAGVKEGSVRIRGALENSGFKFPLRRITVNLAPADLRKDGAAFDVPIAMGILSGAGLLPPESFEDALLVGELALDGSVRPVKGVLPVAAYARACAVQRLFVPRDISPSCWMSCTDRLRHPSRRCRPSLPRWPRLTWPRCAARRSHVEPWRSQPPGATTCSSSGHLGQAKPC